MNPGIDFTDDFKAAIASSRTEALSLRCDFIASNHLLLGVLHGEGDRARGILAGLIENIEELPEKISAKYRDIGLEGDLNIGNVPLTEEAESVVKGAIDEGKALGAAAVGSEHLLLSMLKNPESSAFKSLQPYNVSYDSVLNALK